MSDCMNTFNFQFAVQRDEYTEMQRTKKRNKMAPLQQVPGVTYDDDEQSKLIELFQQLDFYDIIADSPRRPNQVKRSREEQIANEMELEPCPKQCNQEQNIPEMEIEPLPKPCDQIQQIVLDLQNVSFSKQSKSNEGELEEPMECDQ